MDTDFNGQLNFRIWAKEVVQGQGLVSQVWGPEWKSPEPMSIKTRCVAQASLTTMVLRGVGEKTEKFRETHWSIILAQTAEFPCQTR